MAYFNEQDLEKIKNDIFSDERFGKALLFANYWNDTTNNDRRELRKEISEHFVSLGELRDYLLGEEFVESCQRVNDLIYNYECLKKFYNHFTKAKNIKNPLSYVMVDIFDTTYKVDYQVFKRVKDLPKAQQIEIILNDANTQALINCYEIL